MNLFLLLWALIEIPVYWAVLWFGEKHAYQRGLKEGRDEGLKEGYRRGFTDAQAFSDLWWQVAENDVQAERAKLGKVRDEERWP